MTKNRFQLPGYPLPLGARITNKGVQFSVFSRHATEVSLILFETPEPDSPFEEVKLDKDLNKTGDIWHIWIEGINEGQLYGYKIDGPYNPEKGHRFNKYKLLLDPYARAVSGNFDWVLSDPRGYDADSQFKDAIYSTKDSSAGAPKSIVINHEFDWFDRPLKIPLTDTIIYETHVKGFSFHESSSVYSPGTYKGLTEKIPYLKDLGITAVELLPIQEFDENENTRKNPITGEKLKNYWGYSTMSFFAPRGRYSSKGALGEQFYEFKEMVRDFHNAGIEVFLDVVFNHTAEGDQTGPTMCFRGIDNSIYYMLESDKRYYKNYSGCGNTFNCNNPIVREFIIDCLKYWVIEMHVDGFRFDLASILGRDQEGNILKNPPLIERIESDPILRSTKIIAEAWDAAGAYQVGHFPGRWAEWNGKFRDDVRRFWRGDTGTAGAFATRITGSSDLYSTEERSPLHSINFITAHDGFTLRDLVSFKEKHNEENGENNADGENHNISMNFGIEGNDVTPFIEKERRRMIKNYFASLLLSQGVPMILSGDEFCRTQKGNNNAYCQDNEISWINWNLLESNKDMFNFVKSLIAFRKRHTSLRRKKFLTGGNSPYESSPDISWHGTTPGKPDWTEETGFIACLINGFYSIQDFTSQDADIFMAFNSSKFNRNTTLPESPNGGSWKRIMDTSLDSPDDFCLECSARITDKKYLVKRYSSVLFISERN